MSRSLQSYLRDYFLQLKKLPIIKWKRTFNLFSKCKNIPNAFFSFFSKTPRDAIKVNRFYSFYGRYHFISWKNRLYFPDRNYCRYQICITFRCLDKQTHLSESTVLVANVNISNFLRLSVPNNKIFMLCLGHSDCFFIVFLIKNRKGLRVAWCMILNVWSILCMIWIYYIASYQVLV